MSFNNRRLQQELEKMTDESLKACFSQGIVEMVLLIREKPDDIQLQINLVATSLMKIVEELKRRGIE